MEVIRGPGSAIYGANALMGVINIITRRIDAGTHARVALTAGDWGQVRADLSFASSLGGERGVRGRRPPSGARTAPASPPTPAEDVLTAGRGPEHLRRHPGGREPDRPAGRGRVAVNGYGPSYNVFLKYQHDDGSAVRLLAARSALDLQRTHRQSLVRRRSRRPRRP